jgi:prophage maintenance system killer protein
MISILEELKKRGYDEPVSDIEDCDIAKLSSSIKAPFTIGNEIRTNEDFCLKAAKLFCFLIENHCCGNSNKRLAVVSLGTLFDINGYLLEISDIKLYGLAMSVTLLSKYKLFDKAVMEVKDALLDAMVTKKGRPISQEQKQKMEKEFENFMLTKVL